MPPPYHRLGNAGAKRHGSTRCNSLGCMTERICAEKSPFQQPISTHMPPAAANFRTNPRSAMGVPTSILTNRAETDYAAVPKRGCVLLLNSVAARKDDRSDELWGGLRKIAPKLPGRVLVLVGVLNDGSAFRFEYTPDALEVAFDDLDIEMHKGPE